MSVSTDGGATFTGTSADPRTEQLVTTAPGQKGTDRCSARSAPTRATASSPSTTTTARYRRRRDRPAARTSRCRAASSLVGFGREARDLELDAGPDAVRGSARAVTFYGDYVGLAAIDQAHAAVDGQPGPRTCSSAPAPVRRATRRGLLRWNRVQRRGRQRRGPSTPPRSASPLGRRSSRTADQEDQVEEEGVAARGKGRIRRPGPTLRRRARSAPRPFRETP